MAQVAHSAVGISQLGAQGTVRRLGFGMSLPISVLVLMFVMTDMPPLDCLFVLAIPRSRCPGELERQKDKQQN